MSQVEVVSITLPATVVESASALAAKENRSVGDLLEELVATRASARAWDELKQYGRSRAQSSGYSEDDVVALVREVRAELAAKRRESESKDANRG